MKRFTAFSLLLIMALVAIHPVVAMHFCGDEIQSLHLYQAENNHACCHSALTDAEAIHIANYCDVEISKENNNQILETLESMCCDFQVTKLSTDDFQNQQQSNFNPTLLPASNLLFLFNSMEIAYLPEINTTNLKKTFPPTGRFLADVDLVSFICVNIN